MLRNILLLLIGVIGLAIVRNIVREVGRVVTRSMGFKEGAKQRQAKAGATASRRLVQDPHTGTYVDPDHAVRAKVGGQVHHFESEATRDAYVKAARA
ncbi:MAG: hypothetical protein OXN97_19945 [Bryobacterales bacterium]|nr:hypothetical protein [Bryobacterales bacterium]